MCYELKAIFRNKVTMVCLFLCVLLGLQGFVNMMRRTTGNQVIRDELRQIDNTITYASEHVESVESAWNYHMNVLCNTEAERRAIKSEYYYNMWLRDSHQEIYDLLDSGIPSNMGKAQELYGYAILTSLLCEMNMYSCEEQGRPKAEEVFAKEIERYSDVLQLEKLPFELSDLADSPFMDGATQQDMAPFYYATKMKIEERFEWLANQDFVNVNISSPYTFLAFEYAPDSATGAIVGSLVLLFSAFYMAECRKNRSRELQEMRPQRSRCIMGYYYKNIMMTAAIFLLCAVGIPMLLAGALCGWGGLQAVMTVDPANFNGWKPYEHYEVLNYYNLSPIFGDYQYHGESMGITLCPMNKIPLWQFMIFAFVVAALKLIFLTLLGFFIGYFGKKQGRTILAAAIAAGIYAVCQFVGTGMNWNPFSVKTAWWVTAGGSNMTWLNAVILLGISIVILTALLLVGNRKREYC